MDEILEALRSAVNFAHGDAEGHFNFEEKNELVGGVEVRGVIVTYADGNEFLSLNRLHQRLNQIGQLEHFEFRGRGGNEVPHLVALIRIGEQLFNLTYILPAA